MIAVTIFGIIKTQNNEIFEMTSIRKKYSGRKEDRLGYIPLLGRCTAQKQSNKLEVAQHRTLCLTLQ